MCGWSGNGHGHGRGDGGLGCGQLGLRSILLRVVPDTLDDAEVFVGVEAGILLCRFSQWDGLEWQTPIWICILVLLIADEATTALMAATNKTCIHLMIAIAGFDDGISGWYE